MRNLQLLLPLLQRVHIDRLGLGSSRRVGQPILRRPFTSGSIVSKRQRRDLRLPLRLRRTIKPGFAIERSRLCAGLVGDRRGIGDGGQLGRVAQARALVLRRRREEDRNLGLGLDGLGLGLGLGLHRGDEIRSEAMPASAESMAGAKRERMLTIDH
jgi:hypothetical protein